jgi:hypothetical protein
MVIARALLLALLAAPAAAQSERQDVFVTDPVTGDMANVTGVGELFGLQVKVINGVAVTTVNAQVPIQRTQAANGTYYSAGTDFVSLSGTGEVALFLFVNLSTNTLTAYMDNARFISASGSTETRFRLYRSPVVTSSGTAVSIFPGKAGTENKSKMQGYQTPAVSSNGVVVFREFVSVGTRVFALTQSRQFPPGSTFLVTAQNSSTNRLAAFAVEWSEE